MQMKKKEKEIKHSVQSQEKNFPGTNLFIRVKKYTH